MSSNSEHGDVSVLRFEVAGGTHEWSHGARTLGEGEDENRGIENPRAHAPLLCSLGRVRKHGSIFVFGAGRQGRRQALQEEHPAGGSEEGEGDGMGVT